MARAARKCAGTNSDNPRLGQVSVSKHARAIRDELIRRKADRDFVRDFQSDKAVGGNLRALIESAGGTHKTATRGVGAAFASGAGSRPWANAKAAIPMGALLAAPTMVLQLFAFGNMPLNDLRFWTTAALLGAILPAELFQLLIVETSGFSGGWAVLIRVGQVVTFCVGLGLLRERRLANRADLPWRMIRDFRSARTLAVPASAVIVAVVTALGTAFAAAAVAAALEPPTPAVSPAPAK